MLSKLGVSRLGFEPVCVLRFELQGLNLSLGWNLSLDIEDEFLSSMLVFRP